MKERIVTDGKVRITVRPLKLAGLYEIVPEAFHDDRGYLCRIWDEEIFRKAGLDMACVQESQQHTHRKHTVRGFHVALPPHLEGKTITATQGRTRWVSIDVRKGSETFGQWIVLDLDAEKQNMLYAEKGFAHGSLSLTDDCHLVLRADGYFHQGTGIRWDDPELGVAWGLDAEPVIRERDANYPSFAEFKKQHGGT